MYYEANKAVNAVEFDYDAIDALAQPDVNVNKQWDMALIHAALSVCLEMRVRSDGLRSHVAAFAVLLEVPGWTISEAALRMKVSKRSIQNALKRLKSELAFTLKIEAFRPNIRALTNPRDD